MRMLRFFAVTAALTHCLMFVGAAGARTIAVDGDPSDWIGLPPPMLNMGQLHRSVGGEGEFFWLDAPIDERTDFSAPDPNMDLLAVRITADATHLYLLLEFADTFPPAGPGALLAMVGLDLDRIPGSGNTFLSAFSDTEVSPAAAWEYQIQTQIDLGLPTPAVLDAGYNDMATPLSSHVVSPTAVEMAVAWSDLGLAGPPPSLAMTIGVCQGDGTGTCSDLGGVSDVLDAVTNYGLVGGMGNTWNEVSDGFIDYHFELWFEPDGDPMPPVLINEVYYDTAGTDSEEEFIELVDMTGTGLDISGYFVSDEETPGGGEGSMQLPPGAAFAGSVMILALNEAGFQALFGSLPDYDTDAGSATPDLIPQGTWSSGFATALGNSGDEVLLFDRFGNLIDVVTYEGNAWPGVTDHPGVGTGFSIERCHPTEDNNDCAQEFFAQASPSPVMLIDCGAQGDVCGDGNQCLSGFCADGVCCESACDGACDATCNGASPGSCEPVDCNDGEVCTDDSCDVAIGCVNVDNTAPCDDGDACTTGDTCAGGTCFGGLPADCDDGNPCTDDSCNAAVGCVHVDNSDPCDDFDACTTGDTCAGGSCVGGAPPDCDDGNVCTDDSCDAAVGCVNVDNTAACDDGDACTTGDACAGGSCFGGLPPDCDDGNPCTDDSCDAAVGCVYADNSVACDDGDACTLNDTCAGGTCVGGAPPDCDDGNVCTDDSCDVDVGCVNVDNTAACDDGDACTTNDTCAAGSCVGGAPPNCDDGNVCTDDSCDVDVGCVNVNNTAACDDGDACTTNDTCAAGSCVGGAAPNCDDANVCTDDSCDPDVGCVNTDNTDACDDGDACTMDDTCANGACGGVPQDADGDGYVDGACPAGNDCDDQQASVNPGVLEAAFGDAMCEDSVDNDCDGLTDVEDSGCQQCATDADCADENLCNGTEACVDGLCQAGQALDCDDGNLCTNDSCDPASGCIHANNSVPCDDGDACTTSDLCSGGSCAGGAALNCDDANPCTDDACDPASGCTYSNNAAGCDDGDACTAGDTCAGGACVPGPGLPCDDENPCTDDACDPDSGCTFTNNTAACDDGDACTIDDVCADGSCTSFAAADCDDDDVCTDDSCDPATGCVNVDNTAACDDGDRCTESDTCSGGTCAGRMVSCAQLDGDCVEGVCDPATGSCVAQPLDDGTACEDGEICTVEDSCQAGVCTPGYDNCSSGGCGCSAGGSGQPFAPAAGMLLLLGLALWRRRD